MDVKVGVVTESRLRIVFLLILAFSVYCILTGAHIYPAVRFPQFPNKKKGSKPSYQEVRLYGSSTREEVDLMCIIQPYDKQYYLFAQQALLNEKVSDKMLEFVNALYRHRYHTQDSLFFTQKTVETQ